MTEFSTHSHWSPTQCDERHHHHHTEAIRPLPYANAPLIVDEEIVANRTSRRRRDEDGGRASRSVAKAHIHVHDRFIGDDGEEYVVIRRKRSPGHDSGRPAPGHTAEPKSTFWGSFKNSAIGILGVAVTLTGGAMIVGGVAAFAHNANGLVPLILGTIFGIGGMVVAKSVWDDH